MSNSYPEKTCSIDRLVTHDKLVSAALSGAKTQQRRAGVYGYPGELFDLQGTEFVITGLRTERWGDISEADAQAEGYPNLAMYRALIERMHQGMEWDQDQPVWVHEFAKTEVGDQV
ncbi:MAG: ASCH domain-containing protein [Planctomycetaceae bacterium]|nr:ASCH domain-containing protein [Planctomycetaceae bacterium]